MSNLVPVALVAAICGLLFVAMSRRAALAAGWFDRRNGREGGPEYRRIPRLGGVGIVASVMLCLIPTAASAAGIDTQFVWAALIPAVIAGVVGIVDDVRNVKPAVKALALLGLGLWSWSNGLAIGFLPDSTPAVISALATMCWFIAIPTAINFVDGLDGLAAGLTVIASVVLSLLGFVIGDATITVAALALGAATTGFWWHNRHPARIFMGDGGAMFIGYLLAALAARITVNSSSIGVDVAVLLALSIPLFDFGSAMLRRFRRRAPFSSDADHIHHRLARKLGHREAVSVLHRVGLGAAVVGIAIPAYEQAIPLLFVGSAIYGFTFLLRSEPGVAMARAATAVAVLLFVAGTTPGSSQEIAPPLALQTERPAPIMTVPPAPEGSGSPLGDALP